MEIGIIFLFFGIVALFFWLSINQVDENLRLLYFMLGIIFLPVTIAVTRVLAIDGGLTSKVSIFLENIFIVMTVLSTFITIYIVVMLIKNYMEKAQQVANNKQEGNY